MDQLNLIRVFEFYLALMLVLGLSRRYPVYWDMLRLMIAVRGRWPKLLQRMAQHHGLLVKTEVIRPLVIMLALMLTQFLVSRLLFPEATVTWGDVSSVWWRLALLCLGCLPMFGVDGYFLLFVGQFDRHGTEKSLDQAERWLTGWKASAVSLATLGYVNPKRMVDEELQKGLVQLRETVSWTARWVSIQIACRMACGFTIWILWFTLPNPIT
jgi:hypothetical protein